MKFSQNVIAQVPNGRYFVLSKGKAQPLGVDKLRALSMANGMVLYWKNPSGDVEKAPPIVLPKKKEARVVKKAKTKKVPALQKEEETPPSLEDAIAKAITNHEAPNGVAQPSVSSPPEIPSSLFQNPYGEENVETVRVVEGGKKEDSQRPIFIEPKSVQGVHFFLPPFFGEEDGDYTGLPPVGEVDHWEVVDERGNTLSDNFGIADFLLKDLKQAEETASRIKAERDRRGLDKVKLVLCRGTQRILKSFGAPQESGEEPKQPRPKRNNWTPPLITTVDLVPAQATLPEKDYESMSAMELMCWIHKDGVAMDEWKRRGGADAVKSLGGSGCVDPWRRVV